MAGGITDVLNNRFRLSGMSSGLDTDSMVQQLMKVERIKVDRVKQDRQILEWRRDDYRSITNLLRGFRDEFFDVLKPSSNMRSQSNYKVHSASSSNTSSVTASASSDAIPGTHVIKDITLAAAANSSSSSKVTKALESTSVITDFNFTAARDFYISLNGVSRKVTIQGDYSNADPAVAVQNLAQAIQNAANSAFGANRVTVSADTAAGKIRLDSPDSKIAISSGTTDALGQLKLTSGSTNRLNLSSTLSTLNTGTALAGTIEFKINGEKFTFDTAKYTMNDVISTINSNSSANVTLAYSEVTDKFTLTSKVMGAGTAVTIENISGNLFGAGSAVNITDTAINNGTDAVFTLDNNVGIKRNSNTFTIDGVTYNLLDTAEATITVTQDTSEIYDKIKVFVDKYNEVISTIDKELSEERSRDYLPLTDEQKESMKEDDIKKWEDKAKSGMLRNDSILSGIKNNFRKALFDTITDMTDTLHSIGITTGTYQEKGKLIIDESKLKDAIKNSPDKVMNLFAKESDIDYSPNLSSAQRTERYNENGIVNRLYDILQDNIRTTRDSNNKKGVLLAKAGMIGDITEFDSLISDEIEDKDDLISELIDKLYYKEDNYYRKFAAMEKALSQMNNQSAWLSQQFGGGGQ